MIPHPQPKWRPRLATIVVGILLCAAAVPLAGMAILFGYEYAQGHTDKSAWIAQVMLVTAGCVLVVTMAIAFVFNRAITGPLYDLIARTKRIGQGDRTAIRPLALHGSREIAALSHSLLGMSQRLFDRADYIKTFAAHVSHELKTPVTSIRGAAELLRDSGARMAAEDRARFLANIIDDTIRMTALVDRLKQLAIADNPKTAGVTSIGAVAQASRVPGGIAIITEGAIDTPFAMARENAEIVFSNLVTNAIEHGADRITLTANEEPDGLVVQVADNGVGISPGNADKVFDLFFTTRREAGGTGMGLGIVRSMLEAHGGAIALIGSDSGTCFEVTLKRPAPADAATRFTGGEPACRMAASLPGDRHEQADERH